MSECDSFGFQRSEFVEGGRKGVVVDVDQVRGGWIYRGGKSGESVGYAGGKFYWADRFEVTEGDGAAELGLEGGDVDVKSDGQVIRYRKVQTGDVVNE